jgi:hypothetical protein
VGRGGAGRGGAGAAAAAAAAAAYDLYQFLVLNLVLKINRSKTENLETFSKLGKW